VAGVVLACLMLIACLPVILSGTTRGRAAYDSLNYHEKAIRQFAQELPNPNLKDYMSATTPGYHLMLAPVARFAGTTADGRSVYDVQLMPPPPGEADPTIARQRRVLQFAGLAFTLALLYMVGHWAEGRLRLAANESGPVLAAVCLSLPLLGSPYLYQSAAWLLPDNSAWLGVAAILLLAVRPRVGLGVLVAMGALLVWLVVARQVHLWAAGVVWAAAWVAASQPQERAHGSLLELNDLLTPVHRGAVAKSVLAAVAVTLPAFGVLAGFWLIWDRHLVPPTFLQWHNAGLQPATPAFILSLIALVAPFYASWMRVGFTRAWRDHRGALAVAAVLGLLLAVVPATAYDFEHGRFGAIWNVYRRIGDVSGRSLAIAALAPLGAAVVASGLAGMGVRARWVMLGALAGFAAANSANPQLWQRYHEPFVLIWMTVAAAITAQRAPLPADSAVARFWRLAGPFALAVTLAAVNAVLIVRTPPQYDEGYRPGRIETPPQQVPPEERPS